MSERWIDDIWMMDGWMDGWIDGWMDNRWMMLDGGWMMDRG